MIVKPRQFDNKTRSGLPWWPAIIGIRNRAGHRQHELTRKKVDLVGGTSSIPIIEISADPEGLSEGFPALHDRRGENASRVAVVIEKGEVARRTLQTRAARRYFEDSGELNSLLDAALGAALSSPASADRDAAAHRVCPSADLEPKPAESMPFRLRTCGTRSRRRQIRASPDAIRTSISPNHSNSCIA